MPFIIFIKNLKEHFQQFDIMQFITGSDFSYLSGGGHVISGLIPLLLSCSMDDFIIWAIGCNAGYKYKYISSGVLGFSFLIKTDRGLTTLFANIWHVNTRHCMAGEQIASWELLRRWCCFEMCLHINSYYLCHSASGSTRVMKKNIPVAPACRHGTVISAAHTSDTDAHTSSFWMQHDRFL